MVTLNAILEALQQPSPWTGMRQLAESLLDRGATLDSARDALYAHAPAVEDFGMTEDQIDAFFDTLDDLGGMCHPDRKFHPRPVATTASPLMANTPSNAASILTASS
jgi:hypothetical protein